MRRPSRGFALLVVVWMLVVAGAIAAEFYATTRSGRRVAANARAHARTLWAGRAGHAHVLAELDRRLSRGGGIGRDLAGDTAVRAIRIRPGPVRVRAFALSARARVNPLKSESGALRRLFAALDLPAGEAERLLDRLLRWRAAHGGARAGRAGEAGRATPERDAGRPPEPFIPAARFAEAVGLTDGSFARVAPHLTLIGDGRIDVNAAPAPVLRALPGIDADAAAAIVRRRGHAPYANVYELIASLPRAARRRIQAAPEPLSSRIAFSPRWLEIVARVETPGSGGLELRRGVEVSGNARRVLPGEAARIVR